MSSVASPRLLITGSAGMLGSAIASSASNVGWKTYVPSREELDLREPSETLAYLRDNRIEFVIHCAAKVGGIAANIASPADFILDNLRIDASIISSARSLKIPKFIYFGSSCMYPKETNQPMRVGQILTSSLEATNEGYALSKIAGAKTVAAIAGQDSLDWRVLIPSNLYGPRDNFNPLTGHLVPSVIRKVYDAVERRNQVVEIWGDGLARREFTFVGDIASFLVDNIHNLSEWPLMMNIGFGVDYSVNEYYELAAKILGFSGQFHHDLKKPTGMSQKLLDSEVARLHGWSPKTNLESGLSTTINWFKEYIESE
jgi:GDP-L-fucose synthase